VSARQRTGYAAVTVVGAGSLGSTQLVTGGGTTTIQTPSSTSTLDSSGNLAVAAGGSLGSADTGTPKFTFASNAATFNKALTTLSLTSQNGTSLGGTAYSYGAPSTTGGAALLIPATTYTVTGSATTANFQADYQGAATFTDASAGTVTDAFDAVKAGPAVAAGSLTITRAHTFGILDSTSASSSITGGLVVAATFGTTATSVGIGGGNINAGGNGTFGGTLSVTGHVTVEGVTSTGATGTGKFVFDGSPTLTTPNLGTPSAINLANATGLTAAQIPAAASVVNSGTITIPSGNSVLVICSSTCSVPIPVPVLGYQICVKNEAGVSTVITLSALGSSAMYPKADDSGYGTAGTGTMVSSAATGNKVCLIGRDSTHYELGAVNASANWTVN